MPDLLIPEARRSRSRLDVFVHFVWATYRRTPWLTVEEETPVYRCIAQQVAHCGCRVWAIGGMPDHVHLLVCMNSQTTLAELMKRAKGTSSAFARDHVVGGAAGWQDNYAAFSVSRGDVSKVSRYIRFQKEHHLNATLWDSVESLDFTIPDESAPLLPVPPEIWWPE